MNNAQHVLKLDIDASSFEGYRWQHVPRLAPPARKRRIQLAAEIDKVAKVARRSLDHIGGGVAAVRVRVVPGHTHRAGRVAEPADRAHGARRRQCLVGVGTRNGGVDGPTRRRCDGSLWTVSPVARERGRSATRGTNKPKRACQARQGQRR